MSEQKRPPNYKHGLYTPRTLTCQAPGCGKEFVTRAAFRGARFCSSVCRTQYGRWSFRVASVDTPRALGVTR